MKFNPGQTRQVIRGVTYIKDTSKTQVNPQPINPPQLKEEPKINQDELQHKQVDEKPVFDGSRTPGKSSSTNKSNTSGKPRV